MVLNSCCGNVDVYTVGYELLRDEKVDLKEKDLVVKPLSAMVVKLTK